MNDTRTPFDRWIARMILLAVAMALLGSFFTRAHGAALTPDCFPPKAKATHKAAAPRKAKRAAPVCPVVPAPALAPLPEALEYLPPPRAHHWDLPPEPAAMVALTPAAYVPAHALDWGWVDMGGFGGFGGSYASARTTVDARTYTLTTVDNHSTTTDYHPVTTTTYDSHDVMTSNDSHDNAPSFPPLPPMPKGGSHDHKPEAYPAPELKPEGAMGGLTFLLGAFLVLIGRRPT